MWTIFIIELYVTFITMPLEYSTKSYIFSDLFHCDFITKLLFIKTLLKLLQNQELKVYV